MVLFWFVLQMDDWTNSIEEFFSLDVMMTVSIYNWFRWPKKLKMSTLSENLIIDYCLCIGVLLGFSNRWGFSTTVTNVSVLEYSYGLLADEGFSLTVTIVSMLG